MIYSFFADLILVLHLCFILFATLGGFLLLRRKRLWKIHLPTVIWAFLVQYFMWSCPLTTWENYFRELAGEAGYKDGFVNYFLTALLYPDTTAEIHIFLAVGVLLANIFVYAKVFYSK